MFEKHFKVKMDGKEVLCRTYTLREYMRLNIAKTNKDSEQMKQAYSEIIANNTTGRFNKHESELLLIHLLAHSEHQDQPSQFYHCECGHRQEIPINVNNAYIDYDGTSMDELYPIGKFKLKLRWPELWTDDDITSMIVNCIEAIYVGQERIEIDDLNDAELDDLYEMLTEDHIQKIKTLLLKPKPVLPVPIKCSSCGKSHGLILRGFKSFTEIL